MKGFLKLRKAPHRHSERSVAIPGKQGGFAWLTFKPGIATSLSLLAMTIWWFILLQTKKLTKFLKLRKSPHRHSERSVAIPGKQGEFAWLTFKPGIATSLSLLAMTIWWFILLQTKHS